jgi:hypothetical protein
MKMICHKHVHSCIRDLAAFARLLSIAILLAHADALNTCDGAALLHLLYSCHTKQLECNKCGKIRTKQIDNPTA